MRQWKEDAFHYYSNVEVSERLLLLTGQQIINMLSFSVQLELMIDIVPGGGKILSLL